MLTADHATTSLYLFKYSPGQIARHKGRFYFNLNMPMGVNTVSSLFPDLCQLAGVVGRKTPHMMRTFVATRLANDPRVSQAEVAAALRHKSLASQKAYVVPTKGTTHRITLTICRITSIFDKNEENLVSKWPFFTFSQSSVIRLMLIGMRRAGDQ